MLTPISYPQVKKDESREAPKAPQSPKANILKVNSVQILPLKGLPKELLGFF